MTNVCNRNKSHPPIPPKIKKGKQKTMTNENTITSRKHTRGSTVTINGLLGISFRWKNERWIDQQNFFFVGL